MKKIVTFASILSLTLMATPALALNLDMTPGLWEHSFTMTSENGELEKAMREMQKQLANMPEAQRKMIEEMLASQGISKGADGTSVKMCMTKEQIERVEQHQQDEYCTQEIIEQGKNKYKINFNCTGNPPVHGSGEMHLINPKNYTGNSTFTTETQGKKEVMTMSQVGKWLSADCGNIKPMEP